MRFCIAPPTDQSASSPPMPMIVMPVAFCFVMLFRLPLRGGGAERPLVPRARGHGLVDGDSAGRRRSDRRSRGLVRNVHERLALRLLGLRVSAVGDVCVAVAVDGDADEVEERAVRAS